jgi:hypothetical protein
MQGHIPQDKLHEEKLREVNKGIYEVNSEFQEKLDKINQDSNLSDKEKSQKRVDEIKKSGFNKNIYDKEAGITPGDKKGDISVCPMCNQYVHSDVNKSHKTQNIVSTVAEKISEGAEKVTDMAKNAVQNTKEYLTAKF